MRTRIELKKRGSSQKSEPPPRKSIDPIETPSSNTKNSNLQFESLDTFKSFMHFMKEKHNLSMSDIITLYKGADKENEHSIPLSIFATSLSPSESLCKYLKENAKLTYHQIAVLINRDDRGVWTSYQRAIKKMPERFSVKKDILLPVEIFQDRDLSILEAIVFYLKQNYDFTTYKIAGLINKNPCSLSTVYSRALTKKKKKKIL